MRQLLAVLSIVVTLVASRLIYPTTMLIDSIYDDTVRLVTSTGFVYEMEGAEDYQVGDMVSVLMFSNGTEVITDDIIVSVQYSGFYISDRMIVHD